MKPLMLLREGMLSDPLLALRAPPVQAPVEPQWTVETGMSYLSPRKSLTLLINMSRSAFNNAA